MFDLKKFCFEKEPENHIKLDTMIIYGMVNGKIHPPLYPDLDPVYGYLLIRDNTDAVIYSAGNIITNAYYGGLIHYFHLAQLYDPLYRFWVYKIHNQISLNIYISCEHHHGPVFIPGQSYTTPSYRPELVLNTAVNSKIEENYNKPFQIKLYNYQENNVQWMMSIEDLCKEKTSVLSYPNLKKVHLTRVKLDDKEIFWNPLCKMLYPLSHEKNIPISEHLLRGGILCDDVGLGKTFSVFGLILNTGRELQFYEAPRKRKEINQEIANLETITDNKCKWSSTATIVAVPPRLVGQWRDELYKFIHPNSDIRVYAISSITNYKKITIAELCNADVIVISYNFFVNQNYIEWAVGENPRLTDFYWKRIILDEGHEVLTPDLYANFSIRRELNNLQSQFRWICTGTPFPHLYDTLDQYLTFLTFKKYVPDDWRYFSYSKIKSFLHQYTRKNTLDSIKDQISIPEIESTTVLLTQDPVERAMYVNATGDITRMIQICTNILVSAIDRGILGGGVSDLQDIKQRMVDHYGNQINQAEQDLSDSENKLQETLYNLDHMDEQHEPHSMLWRDAKATLKTAKKRWQGRIKDLKIKIIDLQNRKNLFENFSEWIKNEQCVICYGDMTSVALTKCSHIFCQECMTTIMQNKQMIRCPLCRTELQCNIDIGFMLEQKDVPDTEYQANVSKWGTKMAWLIQYLEKLLSLEHRVIIFSQWKKMLKLVGKVLTENDIKHAYLQGTSAHMAKSMRAFKESNDLRVLMLSSETCSSGSNLTEASHVILLDTVNGDASRTQAIEEQAIGRAARLGQDKHVQVVRLVMDNTIEYDHYSQNVDHTNITEIKGDDGVLL